MRVRVQWADGEHQHLAKVKKFSKQWVGDEYLFVATHYDGSETHYTGKKLAVTSGSEES